jgi:hypothetical protein
LRKTRAFDRLDKVKSSIFLSKVRHLAAWAVPGEGPWPPPGYLKIQESRK